MPRLRHLLAAGLVLAGSAARAASPAADPALFGDLRWRLIGPFRGGRVLAVSGVPGQPERFFFGAVNGGVWETDDAGRTWRSIFDDQPVGSIGALAVAPSAPRTIYVGTGEADMRSDIAQGEGVFKSTDGGKTWRFSGLADSQQIARFLVHPDDPSLVYVAALGHPYGPNPERGVFRSRDGGATWQKVLGPDDATGAIDLAFEPGNPRVLYAALWHTRRTPWSVYPPSSGPGGGIWKSMDGGDTWKPLAGGLPKDPGRIGLAVAPSNPRRVYAVVDAAADTGGLYRSDDAGATWTRANGEAQIWQRGWYFGEVTVEPADPDVVYLPNVNLFRSTDGGKTFATAKGAPGGDDYHALWIDPKQPARRILGVDQGAVVSTNGGETWSSWYNQPTGQFYHLATDARFPYWVYGPQQDSGAAGVPSRTNGYDGIEITHFREITAGGESDYVAPDPLDPEVIFGGRVEKLDLRTEQTRSVDPTLAYPERYRRTWTLPLVFSRRDPRVLYYANQRLFRTADGGEHWAPISPDLTREDPGVPPNLDAATAAVAPSTSRRRGVIYTIAPSRTADRDLWVGTDDGLVWRTRDEGGHWADVTPPGLAPWSKVGILETSPFDAETAYAAVDRHRLEDRKPYLYRTHDGGAHWQLAVDGIPDGSFVNAVRADPVTRGLLYAGTEKGVYVSFDDGDRWQPLQAGLPATSVRDLEVHGDDLVIATHGRAFWVLDDVTPLRQLGGTTEHGAVRLFRPAAVRFRPAGFTGSPMPMDEPRALNPPAGAYLDYVLPAAAKAVTLEIRDGAGALVRRYASGGVPPKPETLGIAPEWVRPPTALSAAAGMHRFVWPLRYGTPAALAHGDAYADGLWAPPGDYTVVLEVDGARLEQPLTIVPDPRLKLPPAAYAEEFALARRVEGERARVAAASHAVEAVETALAERRKGARPDLAKAIDALASRLHALSGAAPPGAWWMPPAKLESLRFVDDALGRLAIAVDGADAAPSPDARAGLDAIRPALDATLAVWKEIEEKDLPALNARLRKAGKAPIALPK